MDVGSFSGCFQSIPNGDTDFVFSTTIIRRDAGSGGWHESVMIANQML